MTSGQIPSSVKGRSSCSATSARERKKIIQMASTNPEEEKKKFTSDPFLSMSTTEFVANLRTTSLS
jgi:hypothetical protein